MNENSLLTSNLLLFLKNVKGEPDCGMRINARQSAYQISLGRLLSPCLLEA